MVVRPPGLDRPTGRVEPPRRAVLPASRVALGSLAPEAGDDFLLHVGRHLLVRVELHGVRGPALGPRTEVGSVTEHLRERHLVHAFQREDVSERIKACVSIVQELEGKV